jgi:nitrous oxidase accessory protein
MWGKVVLVGASFLLCTLSLVCGDVVPTDGMTIRTSTRFLQGTYNLPNGVVAGANNIVIDMNGAVLIGKGTGQGFGLSIENRVNVTVSNGTLRGYYYGIKVQYSRKVSILSMNLSNNWVDPNSLGPNPPWLNINVGPDLTDRVNLGGGLFMQNVSQSLVANSSLCNQENGMDLFYVNSTVIRHNNCSSNTGWGIHLHQSSENQILGNEANHCNRANLGDSASILLNWASNKNRVVGNQCKYSGDGFFIGNQFSCPSNFNFIAKNNCSYASANAFECTFSVGNIFQENIAEHSSFGFWLGFSHDGNVLLSNSIRFNSANGVEIDHGQHNFLIGNHVERNNGHGIFLQTDGTSPFPPSQYPCLHLPDQSASSWYNITDNIFTDNGGFGLMLTQTTDSLVWNNIFTNSGNVNRSAASDAKCVNTRWGIKPVKKRNIVNGPYQGGNYWSNYKGKSLSGNGIGDTLLPYTNNGHISLPGDIYPLIDELVHGF